MELLRVSSNWACRRQTLHFRRQGVVVIYSDIQEGLVAYELTSSFSLSTHYLGVTYGLFESIDKIPPSFRFAFCEAWHTIAITKSQLLQFFSNWK